MIHYESPLSERIRTLLRLEDLSSVSMPMPHRLIRMRIMPRCAPEITFGSWCGKKFNPRSVVARPGWQDMPAGRNGELHEVKSSIILQPGPAALTEGLDALHALFARWAQARSGA